MARRKLGPSLVDSHTSSERPAFFFTADEVPATGIYRVTHDAHRLPHNVMLFQGQTFPRCAKCEEAVTFALLQVAPASSDTPNSFRVYLYELPVVDDADDNEAAAG